jgi:hypothetical protein
MGEKVTGAGTRDDPWVLKTPPGTSEYQMYRDESADPSALACQVGSTRLAYNLRNGYRGRFAMYVPPLMEALGLAELTHDAKYNRMRAR